MTMDEVIDAHNKLATEQGKPTVGTFKSLKAARAALVKLQTPAAPKEVKERSPNAVERGPVQGIGVFCKQQIIEGRTNKEILEMIAEQYPSAKTTGACVAYYRSKLVLAGKIPKPVKKVKAEASNDQAQAAA